MNFYNEFSLWNHSVETVLSDTVKNQNFYKALSSHTAELMDVCRYWGWYSVS